MEVRKGPSAADPGPIHEERHLDSMAREEHALALPRRADQREQPGNDGAAFSAHHDKVSAEDDGARAARCCRQIGEPMPGPRGGVEAVDPCTVGKLATGDAGHLLIGEAGDVVTRGRYGGEVAPGSQRWIVNLGNGDTVHGRISSANRIEPATEGDQGKGRARMTDG